MDEILNLIVQRTGISQEQARTAVDLIVNQLKSRLPDSVKGLVDGALTGTGGAAGGLPNLGEAASGLGKLLG